MRIVNMHDAKTNLSRLVEDLESGRETEIAIARNGRTVARLIPIERSPIERRLGIARGQFVLPDRIDALDKEIEDSFS